MVSVAGLEVAEGGERSAVVLVGTGGGPGVVLEVHAEVVFVGGSSSGVHPLVFRVVGIWAIGKFADGDAAIDYLCSLAVTHIDAADEFGVWVC